jgi:hypothetical protein
MFGDSWVRVGGGVEHARGGWVPCPLPQPQVQSILSRYLPAQTAGSLLSEANLTVGLEGPHRVWIYPTRGKEVLATHHQPWAKLGLALLERLIEFLFFCHLGVSLPCYLLVCQIYNLYMCLSPCKSPCTDLRSRAPGPGEEGMTFGMNVKLLGLSALGESRSPTDQKPCLSNNTNRRSTLPLLPCLRRTLLPGSK